MQRSSGGNGGRGNRNWKHFQQQHPQSNAPQYRLPYPPPQHQTPAGYAHHQPQSHSRRPTPPLPPIAGRPANPPLPVSPSVSPAIQNDVVAFVESMRSSRSHPSAPPSALNVSSITQAICAHFRTFASLSVELHRIVCGLLLIHLHYVRVYIVMLLDVNEFEELLGMSPMQLPVLRQVHTLNQRLWTFVTCFVQSRRINTLYECFQAFLMHEGIRDFHELRIGNSFLHTEAVQSLYPGAVAMLNVSTRDILSHLRQFETILGHDAFRNSSHIDRNQFLQYLSQQYRQPNVEAVGVSIDPTGFGVYIGLLRRLSNQEMKEMKSIEQEFQKGIAEKVFEVTKEKFSAENRKQALEDLLQNRLNTSDSKQDEATAGNGWKKRAHQRSTTSLSLEILKRVTDVDVYLDNVLRRRASSDQQANKKQISSQEIAETDLKIRNQLTRFLMATQKSKHHSRIKVVTWVLCGIMAKIHALLPHDDKLPDEKAEEDEEGTAGKQEKEDDDDSGDECDCCCVGIDTCKCSCTCVCHSNSSDEEEGEDESKSGERVDEVKPQPKRSSVASKKPNQRAEAMLTLDKIKSEIEQCLNKFTENNRIESFEQLLMCFISLEIDMQAVLGAKPQSSRSDVTQDRSVLELVLEQWNECMADEGKRNQAWVQSFEQLTANKSGAGASKSADRSEVVNFIQQCVLALNSTSCSQETRRDMMQQVATRTRLEFSLDTLTEMGIESMDEVMEEAQLTVERNETTASIAKYSSALLSTEEFHYDPENSVAVPGESLRLKKSDEAIAELLRCPYFVDIAQFTNWQQRYAPYCGSLRYFVRTHEMILLDHASSSRSLMFLYCLNGVILRINEESTPSALEMLISSTASTGVQVPPRQIALHLTSMIVKNSGESNFPKQLVQAHLRSLFTAMESSLTQANPTIASSIERYVLEIVLSVPSEFAGWVYKLLEEVVVSGPSELERSMLVERVWVACGNDAEKISLSTIGRLMNCVEWMDKLDSTQDLKLHSADGAVKESRVSIPTQPPVNVKSSEDSIQAITERFTRADQPIESKPRAASADGGGQDTYEHGLPSSTESCYECINQIRKEQFGIGLEIQDEATSSVLKIQQQRLERALKRLSDELYSENTHFVLELLQNADDNSYRPGEIARGEFILTTNQEIIFHNNERGFTPANIQAICDVGASTKSSLDSNTSIGKKGIGFKSVFKVSDSPQVHSNGFHIRFHSKNEEHGAGLGYILPFWIDSQSEWQSRPGTTFVLPLNQSSMQRKDEISESLLAFEPSILLFLRRIQELRIQDDVYNQRLHFLKEESDRDDHQTVQLFSQISHKNSDNATVSQQQWLVIKKSLPAPVAFSTSSDQARVAEIALALPLPGSSTSAGDRLPLQQVFAYLPLRSYGFRFVLQGDFEVPSSREAIVNGSEWNQWLISQFPLIMRQAVVSYVDELLLAGSDLVHGARHLLSLLPLENEIQAPFRGIVLDIMREISLVPFLPSCTTPEDPTLEMMRPVELLDAWEMVQDEEILSVLVQDQDLLFSTLHKKLLHLELSKSVPIVLKNQLRVEKLGVSHILQLLSHASNKNSVTWTVDMLRVLGKLWKKDRNSDLLLQELRLIKCFPLQDHSTTKWVSLMDAHDALFLPLVLDDTREQTQKQPQDLQSLYGELHVLDDKFAAALSTMPDTRSFLIGQVKLKTIKDHDLISHHILPKMISLGKEHPESLSKQWHSAKATTTSYTKFLASHVVSCRSCPVGNAIEKSLRLWNSTNTMMPATAPNLLVLLPSTVREMPQLTKWLLQKLSESGGAAFNVVALDYFGDCDSDKLEATTSMWRKLLVETCKLPELFDVTDPRSVVGAEQLLSWTQAEVASSVKDKISEELARFLDKHWPTGSEHIVPDEVTELWQTSKWLKGSDGIFYQPSSLWLSSPATKALFSETMVPYSTVSWTNEALTGEILKLKKDPSLDDALKVLFVLSSRGGSEVLEVSHLTRMYSFLWEQAQGDDSNAQTIKQAFVEQSLIFVNEDAKANGFAGKNDVVWSSTEYNGNLVALEQLYPSSLRDFFTEVCGIDKKPSIPSLYARLIQLKDQPQEYNSKKRWKRVVLPILKAFAKHAKKSSATKEELRRMRKCLKATPWLPVSRPPSDGASFVCCSTKDEPILPATDDERGLQKLLISLWKDRNDLKLDRMNLVALDTELMEELDPVFKVAKLRSLTSHIVSHPSKWSTWASDMVNSLTGDEKKQRKKVMTLVKALVVMWSKAFASDSNEWSKEDSAFQWKLQQSALFPTLRAQQFAKPVDLFINDQSELAQGDFVGSHQDQQQEIGILSLFPWAYFVDPHQQQNMDDAIHVREFLITFCGAKSLKSHLSHEVIALGALKESSDLFRSKVQESIGVAQRFLFHQHRACYDQLPQDEIVRMCHDLKCVMVAAHDGGFHVVYRVSNKFSLRHTSLTCFLDTVAPAPVLYINRGNGDNDMSGFYDVLMEISRRWFGAQLAATVANVMYLASMQPSADLMEKWLVDTQQLMPLDPNEAGPLWANSSGERVESSIASEDQRRKRSRSVLEDGEVDDESKVSSINDKRPRYDMMATTSSISDGNVTTHTRDPSNQHFEFGNHPPVLLPPVYAGNTEYHQPFPPLPPPLPPANSGSVGSVADQVLTVGNTMTKGEREAIGRWGEEYVYKQLVASHKDNGAVKVEWVNEHDESGRPYDITISLGGKVTEYVEVKSTRTMEKAVFEISMNELDQAAIHGSSYCIYRVFNAGNDALCRVIRMKNPIALVRQKKVQLALVMQ
ncbi:Phosphoserine aminotransferase, partial [Globisporangium splendens]